jgi:hypothetical protein
MITLSIDYEKLKEAIKANPSCITTDKNGKKYLNITVDKMKEVKFSNTHSVKLTQTKEERAAKKTVTYIGNGKEWIFENKPSAPAQAAPPPQSNNDADNLPF